MTYTPKPNTGTLWPPDHAGGEGQPKVTYRRGKVNIGGKEHYLAILARPVDDGVVFEVLQVVGRVWKREKKGAKSPDMGGEFDFEGRKWEIVGWREKTEGGKMKTSVKVNPKGEREQDAGGGGSDPPPDDEIPF